MDHIQAVGAERAAIIHAHLNHLEDEIGLAAEAVELVRSDAGKIDTLKDAQLNAMLDNLEVAACTLTRIADIFRKLESDLDPSGYGLPIEELGLASRTVGALSQTKIKSVGDLIRCGELGLAGLPGIRQAMIQEIGDALVLRGYEFGAVGAGVRRQFQEWSAGLSDEAVQRLVGGSKD